MITVVSTANASVSIGPDLPVVIIGERINPTGRKRLSAALLAGDMSLIGPDAVAQVAAGARIIDINVGLAGTDERALLLAAVREAQSAVDVPLCIDTTNPAALDAALAAYHGKALVNSVTGEDAALERVLPVVKYHGAAVIGLAHDEQGISQNAQARLAAATKIVRRADSLGIPQEDVVIDPLVLSVGADWSAALVTIRTIKLVREELGNNMTLGASNVSFGLPDRESLNANFLAMAVLAGVTCPISNPLSADVRKALLAADLFLGRDEYGAAWIRYYRGANKQK